MAVKDVKEMLIKVEAEMGDAASKIAAVTGKLRELKDLQEALEYQMKSLEVDDPRYQELAKDLALVTEAQKACRKEISEQSRAVQNNIQANEVYDTSLKGMTARLSAMKDELRTMTGVFDANGNATGENAERYRQLQGEINTLNEKISKEEQAYGVYSRNVGNYTNSMLTAFSSLGGSTGKAVTGIKNMTLGLQAMSKTPVIMILGLLAKAIEIVVKNLKSSEENTIAVSQAFGGLRAIGDILTNALQGLGKIVGKIAEGIGNLAKRVAETIPALDGVNERMKERQQIAEAEIALTLKHRDNIVDIAKEERDIADLRTKAADKSTYSAQERLNYLQQAVEKEKNISQMQYEEAKREYELAALKAEQTGNSREDNDALAEAEAKMIRAETTYLDHTRRMVSQISAAKKEMAAEAKQQAEEAARQRAEELAAMQQYVKTLQDNYRKVRDAALGGGIDYEIEKVKEKYNGLMQQLLNSGITSTEELMFYRLQLENREAAEIRAIRQKPIDEAAKAEADRIKQEHDMRAQAYEDALQLAWNDAEAQYNIKHDYLLRELDDENKTAAERAAIEQQLAEMEMEAAEQVTAKRMEALQTYVSAMQEVTANITAITEIREKREQQTYEANDKKKKDALKKRLDLGLMQQEDYDAALAEIEQAADQRNAELARKQAKRQKAVSIFESIVNTAMAVTKTLAELGVPAGIAPAALAGAMGAMQTAAIASEPLPQARKGGLVQGAKHEQGGVLINTEGGERIVGANPSKAFPELLNLISYIGKHGMPDTGYGTRAAITDNTAYNQAAQGSTDTLADRIAVAVQQQPIYVNMTEMRDYENRHADIVEAAKM